MRGVGRKEKNKEINSRRWGYTWYVSLGRDSLDARKRAVILCLRENNGLENLILTLAFRFGIVALLLQFVPVLSMFFLLTTAAGSALWAADLEEEKQRQALAVEATVGGAGDNDEFPPEYTDIEDQV